MENIIKSPYELSVWEDIPVVEYYDDDGNLIKAFRDRILDVSDAGHYILKEGSLDNNCAGSQNFLNKIENTDDYNAIRYMEETKSAIIGSDTMDSPVRAYNLVLKQNVNGTVTLTFSMNRRYYDEDTKEFKWNPFSNLIINERKLKLKYKDQWFDLIIKQVNEDSDKQTMAITAESLPITELAKAGYNVEFDTTLKNNIGTITELAETIVENTDWTVCDRTPGGEDGTSDLLEEFLEEPLYEVHILSEIKVKNIRDESKTVTLNNGDMCYAFYSSLYALKNGETTLQILYDENNNYEIDEDNVIIVSDDQNRNKQYIMEGIEWYDGVETSIQYPTGIILSSTKEQTQYTYIAIETSKPETSGIWPSYIYRGEKLVHNSCQVYEPISQKVCTLYYDPENPEETVYGYTISDYSTTDILTNYIGNGDTFQDASGWDDQQATDTETAYNNMTHAFYPALSKQYTTESVIFDTHRYLCIPKCDASVSPKIVNTKKFNTTVESAFEQLEEGIIQGTHLVFGLCIGTCDTIEKLDKQTGNSYTPASEPTGVEPADMKEWYDVSLVDYKEEDGEFNVIHTYCTFSDYQYGSPYKIEPDGTETYDGILLKLRDEMEEFKDDKLYFTYDEDSKKYKHFKGTEFDPEVKYYVSSASNRYIYSVSSEINQSLSAAMISSGRRSGTGEYEVGKTYNLGLCFNCKDGGYAQGVYTYIEKIQLFDLQYDEDGEVLFIGSTPTAETKELYKYFTIPENALEEEDLVPYWEGFEPHATLVQQEREYPFEKVRTITGKQSNRFNLLQNLCETFECWLRFKIYRDQDTGKIEYITEYDGNIPIEKHQHKELQFKKVVGEHNYRGFYYGSNLKQIKRENDSSELVTKLIVGINSNEFAGNGFCDIAKSKYNPIKDTTCYNMDYYIKQGMIDQEDYILDLTVPYNGHLNFYSTLNKKIASYEAINDSVITMKTALLSIQSNQEVYGKLKEEAREDMDDSMENIKDFLNLPDETSNSDALIAITEEINRKDKNDGTYEIDKSTPLKYLTDYRTDLYNYSTYSLLADQYDREEAAAKEKIVAKQEELDAILVEKKEVESKFYKKYARFIQEGSWIDESYYDDDLYYLDAQNVLYDSAFPQVKYTINVLDLDELTGYENYQYNLGDITYIEDVEFFGYITKDGLKTPYQEEVLISETTDYLDEPEKNVISIQNYKTQFEDLFQRITATTQTLQYASGAYDRTTSVINLDGTINQQMLSESMQNILGAISNGIDKTTELNEDGILSRNANNKDYLVRFKNGAISTSKDNGVTWQDVITPDGINVNKLDTGTINTSEITIFGGGRSSFRWDANNLIAYKATGDTGENGYNPNSYTAFNYTGIRVANEKASDNTSVVRVRLGLIPQYGTRAETFGIALYNDNGEQTLWADSTTGDLYLSGWLHATGGDIGGWKITEDASISSKYVTLSSVEGDTNKAITVNNGTFYVQNNGYMNAASGKIGNWVIGDTGDKEKNGSLYIGTLGSKDGMYLVPNGKTTSTAIGGSSALSNWMLTIGNGFGVTSDGTLYCNNAHVSGDIIVNSVPFSKITADTNKNSLIANNMSVTGGKIGNWHIKNSDLYSFDYDEDSEDWDERSGIKLTAAESTATSRIEIYTKGKIAALLKTSASYKTHNTDPTILQICDPTYDWDSGFKVTRSGGAHWYNSKDMWEGDQTVSIIGRSTTANDLGEIYLRGNITIYGKDGEDVGITINGKKVLTED